MARKIQRAWRRYRTHKLIQIYANKNFFASIIDRYHQSSLRDKSQSLSDSEISEHSDIVI